MVVHDHPALSLSWQCRLLSIGRPSLYYKPKGKSTQNARAVGEGEVELVLELVLPLRDQAFRHDDQAVLRTSPDREFLDQ